MDGVENYNSSDLNINSKLRLTENLDWTSYQKFEVPTVILVRVVIQGLDASNWRWVGSEHIHMDSERCRQCRPPCTSKQTTKIVQSHEWERADKKRTLLRQPCRWKLHRIYVKTNHQKHCHGRKRSTLTCHPSVPTLQKDWGDSKTDEWPITLNICSIRFWMISAPRSSTFNPLKLTESSENHRVDISRRVNLFVSNVTVSLSRSTNY